MMSVRQVFLPILVLAFMISTVFAGEAPATGDSSRSRFNLDSIRNYMESVKEYEKNLKVPENRYGAEGQSKAEGLKKYFYSDEYQKKVRAETQRLKDAVFKDTINEYYPDGKETARATSKTLLSTERIYIFVSSSVPRQTLRNYAVDLDKLRDPGISMVMRGFVGGMKYVKPTLEFVTKTIVKDESCDAAKEKCETYSVNIGIDPMLFRRYRITQVPAVVYVKGLSVVDQAMSEGISNNAKASDFYVVYGDASLDYVLERIHKETKSKSIESILKALRKGFYYSDG